MKQTYFFRPSNPLNTHQSLDIKLVKENIDAGKETTLLIDTNLLIAIEKAVKLGNSIVALEQMGLGKLVSLARSSPPKSLCLSPGRALAEMPPALASISRSAYEVFCSVHLPTFVDAPNAIQTQFKGKEVDFGFDDLGITEQQVLAIPYFSLLVLNLADKKLKMQPLKKLEFFFEKLRTDLNVLSAKEIEIAKYCLLEPKAAEILTIATRRILRSNFLKTKYDKSIASSKEAFAVAFNGACDLMLINAATLVQSQGLDGIPQDCWIATADRKLYEFSSIFGYIDAFGQVGQFAASSINKEQAVNSDWLFANEWQRNATQMRINHQRPSPDDLLISVQRAIEWTSEFYNIS